MSGVIPGDRVRRGKKEEGQGAQATSVDRELNLRLPS